MEEKSAGSRLDWIDLVRGFAILSIVYGHASRDQGLLAKIVYCYHVPLCIFVSGWLYEFKDLSLKEHLKKTGLKLLLPYFIWSILSIGIYMAMGSVAAGALGAETYDLKTNLLFMLEGRSIGNAVLWYLPFLFCTYLMLFFWGKLLKRRTPRSLPGKTAAILLPGIFSVVTLLLYSRMGFPYLPFGISNACFLLVFPWTAYVLRKTGRLPEGKKWLVPAGLLLAVSLFCALKCNDEVVYMGFRDSNYGRNIFAFFLTALSACVLFCWIGKLLGSCRLLQWFGRNAMPIFLMHKFPVLFFQVFLGEISRNLGDFQFLFYLLNTLISASLCCLAGSFLRKYLPFTLGETRK